MACFLFHSAGGCTYGDFVLGDKCLFTPLDFHAVNMSNASRPISTVLPLVNKGQLYAELINCTSHFKPFFLPFKVGKNWRIHQRGSLDHSTTPPVSDHFQQTNGASFWTLSACFQRVDDSSSFWLSNNVVQLWILMLWSPRVKNFPSELRF